MSSDLKEGIKAFLTYILTPSTPVFIVGFAIVLFAPIILHFILHGSSPSYTQLPSVLLLGPSNSGKTALLTLLERNAHPNKPSSTSPPSPSATHTSQTPLTISLPVPSSKLRALLFLVDASSLDDNLPATATYLYDVLLALQKRMTQKKKQKPIPVLIAANKLDLFTALPAALVKSQLEGELGRIRRTRSKGLLDSGVGADDEVVGGGGEEGDEWLGEYGSEKFSFKQMMEFDIEVDVLGGNVVGDGPGVEKWWKWIAERV